METSKFKTKTMFQQRADRQLKGVYPVAIDIGYSGVKVFAPNKVAVFPFFASPYIEKGTIGTLPEDFIIYRDLDNEETWLVGSHAQTDLNSNEATNSDDAQYGRLRWQDPAYKVSARVGLGIAMLPNKHAEIGNRKLVVQTGLPPKFIEDARYHRAALAGHHHFSIQIGSNAPVEFNFDLAPEDIYITMQPMGTLYSAAISNEHKFTGVSQEYLSKNVLILDAGFNTLDFFLVKNHAIKGGESFTNLGMKQVFIETSTAIQKKYGGDKIGVTEMQKYLKTGMVRTFDINTYSTKDEPFGDLLEQASEKVCKKAIAQMSQLYPLQDIDYLIITGGTGAAWERDIRNTFKNMQTLNIVSGNQNETSLPFVFANVRGYYMYLFEVLDAKEKQAR